MNRILTIAKLTWKSAFRYRLFWILAALVAASVIGMPLLLKDDGTAKGLTQILLAYTMSSVATFLGLATLWLSCGTLARDIEECQLQVVMAKPISRWEVWLGKWLGIVGLNAVLLLLAGTSIFFILKTRAAKLPGAEQEVLRNEIFVARASMKDRAPDYAPMVESIVQDRLKQLHRTLTTAEMTELRKISTEQAKASLTEVPPGFGRAWILDLHTLPESAKNNPFQIRVKFNTPNPSPDASYEAYWMIGPTNSTKAMRFHQTLPSDSFQEFTVPSSLLDEYGHLNVEYLNANQLPISFPMEDGFEVLYHESTFGINFIRGMTIILFWLALLSAVGLMTASQLSFPVAAFASLAILFIGLSAGTLQTVVEQGTITGFNSETSQYGHSIVDFVLVPIFAGALKIINLVESFSPIDFLSSGRSITWPMLGMAFLQIVVILGGFFAVFGIVLFHRRELATAQGTT